MNIIYQHLNYIASTYTFGHLYLIEIHVWTEPTHVLTLGRAMARDRMEILLSVLFQDTHT